MMTHKEFTSLLQKYSSGEDSCQGEKYIWYDFRQKQKENIV